MGLNPIRHSPEAQLNRALHVMSIFFPQFLNEHKKVILMRDIEKINYEPYSTKNRIIQNVSMGDYYFTVTSYKTEKQFDIRDKDALVLISNRYNITNFFSYIEMYNVLTRFSSNPSFDENVKWVLQMMSIDSSSHCYSYVFQTKESLKTKEIIEQTIVIYKSLLTGNSYYYMIPYEVTEEQIISFYINCLSKQC